MKRFFHAVCPLLLLTAFVFPALAEETKENKSWEEWKARGKKGAERVEELLKAKKAANGNSVLSDMELCELFVESAFAKFNDPKFLNSVKKSDGGIDSYSLVIQSVDNKSLSQIAFLYPAGVNQLVSISAILLAKKWVFMATNEGKAVLEGEGCRYYFEFKSPFTPKITTFNRQKK